MYKTKVVGKDCFNGADHIFGPIIQIWNDLGPMAKACQDWVSALNSSWALITSKKDLWQSKVMVNKDWDPTCWDSVLKTVETAATCQDWVSGLNSSWAPTLLITNMKDLRQSKVMLNKDRDPTFWVSVLKTVETPVECQDWVSGLNSYWALI
jgi:hypothetical protein